MRSQRLNTRESRISRKGEKRKKSALSRLVLGARTWLREIYVCPDATESARRRRSRYIERDV